MTRCKSVLNVYSRPPCSSLILKPDTRPGTDWVGRRASETRVGPDLRFEAHDIDLFCGGMHDCPTASASHACVIRSIPRSGTSGRESLAVPVQTID